MARNCLHFGVTDEFISTYAESFVTHDSCTACDIQLIANNDNDKPELLIFRTNLPFEPDLK